MILQVLSRNPFSQQSHSKNCLSSTVDAPQLGAGHLWWCPNGCVAYAPWPRRFAFSAKSQGGFLTKLYGPWRLWNWTQDGCLSRIVALCPSPCLVAVDLHIKYRVWMKLTISSFGCPLITPTGLLDMISSEVRWGRYHHDHLACSSMTATYISWMWPPSWDALTQMYMFGRLPKHCKHWIVKGSIRFPSTKMNSLFFIHIVPRVLTTPNVNML